MRCPYLEESRHQNLCNAYFGGLMVPSIYEEEMFCKNILYALCPWYCEFKRKEVRGFNLLSQVARSNFLTIEDFCDRN